MRPCRRHDFALFLTAHGEVSPFQRLLQRIHLRGCKECALHREALLAEKAALTRALSVTLSDERANARLRGEISHRIRSEPRAAASSRNPAFSRRSAVFISLALALVLIVGLLAMRRTGPGARFERWWRTHVLHQADCDTPAPYLRTPPGGTESAGPSR